MEKNKTQILDCVKYKQVSENYVAGEYNNAAAQEIIHFVVYKSWSFIFYSCRLN